jgi:hypothetical protein
VGLGDGRNRDGCERPIAASELEHELEFTRGVTIRLHADYGDGRRG